MRRPAFYSRSPRTPPPAAADAADQADAPASPDATRAADAGNALQAAPAKKPRWQPGRRSFALLIVLSAALVGGAIWAPRPGAKALTQKDIDAAVLRTLQTNTLPSPAAKAADIIRPSVVRVVSERGVGTGVVIVDKGVILTNLHVVKRRRPDQGHLLRRPGSRGHHHRRAARERPGRAAGQKIPDDLIAATMRSTADLAPGDQVAAVGFPFGIGPSASAGVVSGLKRVVPLARGQAGNEAT
jgi:serine protease DegQ